MIKMSWYFLLHFTAIILSFLTKLNAAENSAGIQDVNGALTRLLYFLDDQHRMINVDCIFSLRMVEGQLASVQDSYAEGNLPHVHNTIINSLNNLRKKTGLINRKALGYTLGRDPAYTKSFLRVIDTPFQIKYMFREIQPGFSPKKERGIDDFTEDLSDKCVSNLLGSEMFEPCTFTNECWHFLTMPDTSGYTTTHQALFLLIAEKANCMYKIADKAAEVGLYSIDRLYERICTLIYHEAKQLAEMDTFPDDDKDLFMEQIAICGHAGFYQFLNPKWLQLVLSWQSESGCYKINDESEEDEEDSDKDEHVQREMFGGDNKEQSIQNEHQDIIVQEFDNGDIRRGVKPAEITSKFTGRKLLKEIVLPNTGGCLSHMSGIAAACLTMFFRYFLSVDKYMEFLSRDGNIGVDLEGRVIRVHANNLENIDHFKDITLDQVSHDKDRSVSIIDKVSVQGMIMIFICVCLMICFVKNMRRGNIRTWIKRRF
ncbi:UPF0764 protein C16orf89-like isoform X2 [Antedon mediterranea]|uniref:UPF0764 protein C16orf89-like isoform X2 n=1 Tax=Antedon mediterranea TaxID=105859 RepID=UPI003AF9524C